MTRIARARTVPSLAVHPDRSPIGVVLIEDGLEVIRYFADDAAADEAASARSIEEARALAGAWSDLDWEDMAAELDRIRHANQPTPPIDDL